MADTITDTSVLDINPIIAGADNHNIGNSGFSWSDPTTYGDKLDKITKFSSAAALSGAAGLYDTAASVANWFGADIKINSTQAWITSLDQDLGQYYSQNRESVDLAGFLATGLLPGIVGIKVLNAGQAALKAGKFGGLIGRNMGSYTGLLTNSTESYVTLAANSIKMEQAAFSAINANTAKALAAGFLQNTLEAGAFEVFATAVQYKSPTLEGKDLLDITKDVIAGAAVGGAIGGVLNSASVFWRLGKARVETDTLLRNANSRELLQSATRKDDSIIAAELNREATPDALKVLGPLNPNATAAEQQVYNFQKSSLLEAARVKSQSIDNSIRTDLRALHVSSSNDTVANMVADSLIGAETNKVISNVAGLVGIGKAIARFTTEEFNGVKHYVFNEGIKIAESDISQRWIKLTGEAVGTIERAAPKYLKLADRAYPAGAQSIESSVAEAVSEYRFSQKQLHDPVANMTTADGWQRNEAAYVFWNRQVNIAKDLTFHPNDLPALQEMYARGRLDFKLANLGEATGNKFVPTSFDSAAQLKQYIITAKQDLALGILAKRTSDTPWINETTIARSLDVSKTILSGTLDAVDNELGFFANNAATAAYKDYQASLGKTWEGNAAYIPEYAKVAYDTTKFKSIDGHVINAMGTIAARQKILQDDVNRVVAKQAGTAINARLEDIGLDKLVKANSNGAAATFLGAAKGGYDSSRILASVVQRLGGITGDLKLANKAAVDDMLQGPLYALKNNPAAAIEAEKIKQLITRTTEKYVQDVENFAGIGEGNVWIPKSHYDAYKNAAAAGEDISEGIVLPAIQKGAQEYIRAENWETAQFLKAHTKLTAQRTEDMAERWSVLGKNDQSLTNSNVLRPWREDPKQYPYFALVKDPRVTGAGHTSMLFANTEEQLANLAKKVNADFPEYKVYYKKDAEDYHKAYGDFMYDRSLNENYIDSALQSKGVYSEFFTKSDPEAIVNSMLQYHYRSAEVSASELIRTKYNDAFNWLQDQASAYSRIEGSKFKGASLTTIENTEKNPYISYIKTALGFNSAAQNSLWVSANRILDDSVSKVVGKIKEQFGAAKSVSELDEINKTLATYGINTSIANSAEYALINHTAPKHELSKFVRTANSIMSTFTIGIDPLNALNNAIGANILRGTELTQVTRAISSGNEALVGKLASLKDVNIPGVNATITSPTKLIANAIKRIFDPIVGPALRKEYTEQGFSRGLIEQFASISDDIALKGTETVKQLDSLSATIFSKAKTLAAAGEKYSGNTFAEEFNRVISADVMRQITDVGVASGNFSKAEALTYINTFVNRVEGNIIASQRPGIFQGPVGQAIGLFQSYQFNLMQNMFRYVAEGSAKDTAMLLGLQGTLYGLQGEPGFKFLNDHIIGTASGNTQHRDMYDATRGIIGKTAGDWLLYGTASNIMQTNIYSRGDINPRQLSIIPTSISEVPFVGGISKVFGSLYDTASKVADGGNLWESIRQGIEHNGVYRPLAGLATVASAINNQGTVYSTSSKGTIVGSNDLYSLATLSRLAGGKPLDEAVVNDTMFSIHAYEAVDKKRKDLLAESVKSAVIGKNAVPDDNQIVKFAGEYAKLGGKQGSFNQYMMDQYSKANTSQASILNSKLSNPMSYKIQALLGGDSL